MREKGCVAVLGIFAADLAFTARRLPAIGETLLGEAFVLGPGGKGSNQAVAAGRAGASVTLISKVGDDAFADVARTVWADASVNTAGVQVDDRHPTGTAFIFVSAEAGDNAIIVVPGAAGTIGCDDVERSVDIINSAHVFVTQLEQPVAAAVTGLRTAREAGVITILNPAPAASLPAGMLALCDYVTPNESEAAALTGLTVDTMDDAEAAGRALMAMGAGAAVLTLGARGALLIDTDGMTHVPAAPVEAVRDTTGAGDAFNGAFATALAEGRTPNDAVRFACAAASLAVTRQGAAASMPSRPEIETILATAFRP